MLQNTVTINKKEYGVLDIPFVNYEEMIYLKEGSNNFADLELTLETLVPKLTRMNAKDASILVKTLTQFFIRNDGLNQIITERFFLFNQYPIILVEEKSLFRGGEINFASGCIPCDFINEDKIYKTILKAVIEFGFEFYEYDLEYKFSLNKVVNELSEVLKTNEQLHNYLFSFQLEELSKDKIYVGSNLVDVVSVNRLFREDTRGTHSIYGNYSENRSAEHKIQYERNISNQYKFMVLVHETLHAIFNAYDINILEIAKKHKNDKKNIEEELVHQLGYFLTTTIMDNEAFVCNTLNTIVNYHTGEIEEIIARHDEAIRKDTDLQIRQIKFNEKEEAAIKELEKIKRESLELTKESEALQVQIKEETEDVKKLSNELEKKENETNDKLHGEEQEAPE